MEMERWREAYVDGEMERGICRYGERHMEMERGIWRWREEYGDGEIERGICRWRDGERHM